ncbi:hypothetical protein K4F52_008264 [Lecanicillium sp. MT-2017a]|nr:hypothetical protein K4F52_008264 [Lecanicillium sp. MT-2017a]
MDKMDIDTDDAASTDSVDSSFYGDADTVSALDQRVRAFDVEDWAAQQGTKPSWPQQRPKLNEMASHLHNPYAGVPYAWQLTETLDDFLARLPAATTDQTPDVPWIFICNPFVPRVPKNKGAAQTCKGNENEGPEEEGSRLSVVIDGGVERLELLNTFTNQIASFGKPASVVEREVNKERAQASKDILQLAHAAKVRAGKWLLFAPATEIHELWEIVAKATANNELGIAAKVLPRQENEDPRKDRLICVYTADFMDKADVGRVLQRLRELRLVEARSKRIYYKPDAFTYLGIASGNTWGIKPSIYSSAEVFAS